MLGENTAVSQATGPPTPPALLRVEHAVALALAETEHSADTYSNVLAAIGSRR